MPRPQRPPPTLRARRRRGQPPPSPSPPTAPSLADSPIWTDDLVAQARVPIVDVPFVSIGGGLGSFAVVDLLRMVGVPRTAIAVLTPLDAPYESYRRLAEAAQSDVGDLLRSDSASRIDNLWGFPSYAIEEAWKRRTLRPIGRLVTEPVFSEYYNPRFGQVYAGVDREAARVAWAAMTAKAWVSMVRRRQAGGYFVAPGPEPPDSAGHVAE